METTDRGRTMTEAQLRELSGLLQEIVVTHRRRLRRQQESFRSLPLHDRSSARRRQMARRAAMTSFRVCEEASRALDALEDGSFGSCDRCSCAIAFEELRDRPLTRRCRECDPA
jgi:DnaK suppressor protein